MATLAFCRRISHGYIVVWGEKTAKTKSFIGGNAGELAHGFLSSLNAHKIEPYGTDAVAGVYSVPSARIEQSA